jgi:hypothetical protein
MGVTRPGKPRKERCPPFVAGAVNIPSVLVQSAGGVPRGRRRAGHALYAFVPDVRSNSKWPEQSVEALFNS